MKGGLVQHHEGLFPGVQGGEIVGQGNYPYRYGIAGKGQGQGIAGTYFRLFQ